MDLLKGDLRQGLEILKDVLTEADFPQAEIDKEKILVLASIRSEEDDIFQRGINALRRELFGNSPYALRYLGEEGSVKSMKREDLIDFYKKYCTPDNMVISVSGDVDAASLTGILKDMFKDLKKAGTHPALPEVKKISAAISESIEMDREESLFMLGFGTGGMTDPDRPSLEVLSSVMSGQSGRLFSRLRGKFSLAYTLGCAPRFALNAGYIAFYVATVKKEIPAARTMIAGEIDDIKKNLIKDDEILPAKRELSTNYELSLATNSFVSYNIAIYELYGAGSDYIYKYKDDIDKVTAEDVKKAAEKYLGMNASSEVIIYSKK